MIKKENIISFTRKNKYTLSFCFIVFLFSFIFRTNGSANSIFKDFIFALVSTSIIYLLIDLFVLFKLRWLGIILFSVLITTDLSSFYLFRSPLNYGIVASIFETDMHEAISMLCNKILIILSILGVLIFFLIEVTREAKRRKKRIPFLFSLMYMIICLIIVPILTRMNTYDESLSSIYENVKVSPLLFLADIIPDKYPFIIGDFLYVSVYINEVRSFKNHSDRERVLPEGIKYKESRDIPKKIVLIIGESARRDHMSLYCYDLKTTPFMDSLSIHSEKLIFFDSIICPSSFTRDAIRLTLSYSTVRDKQPFWDNPNIINLANDAGYETIWIANQGRFNVNDTYAGQVAASADTKVYNNELIDLKESTRNDFDLIPHFRSNLKNNEKQFIVLHLAGSHMSYDDKYDDEDSKVLGSIGETIGYDKSIRHTDRVIARIYEILEKQGEQYVVLYYSDHAEVINVGHGIQGRYKEQYRIPLILISDTLIFERYTQKINKYYSDETHRLNTSNLIYFMGEFMGYSVSDSLVEKAKNETEYIYQADGSVNQYSEIKD